MLILLLDSKNNKQKERVFMTNTADEAMEEIAKYMEKTSKKSVPCNILAEIAGRHCSEGGEIVSLFLKVSGKKPA